MYSVAPTMTRPMPNRLRMSASIWSLMSLKFLLCRKLTRMMARPAIASSTPSTLSLLSIGPLLLLARSLPSSVRRSRWVALLIAFWAVVAVAGVVVAVAGVACAWLAVMIWFHFLQGRWRDKAQPGLGRSQRGCPSARPGRGARRGPD